MTTPHEAKKQLQDIIAGNTHITIAAPTGGGKSFFVGLLLEQAYAAGRPWIVLDTSNRNHIGLIALKGVVPFRIRKSVNADYSRLTEADYILCYPDDDMEISDLIEEYRKIISALLKAKKPRIVCVEECHYYSKNASAPDKTLDRLSRIGRKYGLLGWFITQRCVDLPKIMWSSCRWYMFMKYYLHTDKSYLSKQVNNFEKLNEQMNPYDVMLYNSERDEYSIISAASVKGARVTKHYG